MANHRIARAAPRLRDRAVRKRGVHASGAGHPGPARRRSKTSLRLLSLDLLYAHRPDADVLLCCLDNGLTRAEYDWFMAGEPPGYQIMGNDYYGKK